MVSAAASLLQLRPAGLAAGGLLALLAACSPQDAADSVVRSAAERVALPIVAGYMQPAQAEGVTRCLLDAASAGEIRALAQDIGTTGGARPRNNVLALATYPAARACIGRAGLPQLADLAR